MSRTSSPASLDDVIRAAVLPVVARASAAIAKAIAERTEERVARELARQARGKGRRAAARPRPRRRNVEMTEWAADRRARRVPLFVIEATGLDTKKKIVAKFGEGATFHKGKALPPLKQAVPADGAAAPPPATSRQAAARPPRMRKAAGA